MKLQSDAAIDNWLHAKPYYISTLVMEAISQIVW